MLIQFVLPKSEYMTRKLTETHIKLAEKYIFEINDIITELFPLEAISNLLLEKYSSFVEKPQDPLEEEVYRLYKKLLGFYMLTNKLASSVKTEEGINFLNMILLELEYVREDVQRNNYLSLDYPDVKKMLLDKINDCLDRLSTIITLPEIPQDNHALHFLSLAIEESSLSDIVNAINNIMYYAKLEFLHTIEIDSIEQWFDTFNNIYEQCSLEFYTHQIHVENVDAAISLIQKANHLSKIIQRIQKENILMYQLLKLYIYLQYILCQADESNKEGFISSLENLIQQILHEFKTNKKIIFDIDNHIVKEVLIKIENIISNMSIHDVRLQTTRNILELTMEEIHLNDVMDAISHLINEYIEQIRYHNENEANNLLALYDDLFSITIKNPINLKEYLIPPRYHHEIVKNFTHHIIKPFIKDLRYAQLIKKYPLMTDLLAFYYYFFSISIDESVVSNSLVPLLLYCEFFNLIKNKNYFLIYANSSAYFKETIKYIFHYIEYLCQFSSVNAFIVRAMLLDFTVIATFAQGTREYYEAEDGLCAGFVYHIAEHFLVNQRGDVSSNARSLRWNVKDQKSPFEFSINSPFQQVIANNRTFNFQEKDLIEVTSAIQMDLATSEYKFSAGEELAEKLLELIAEHPNTVMRLGVWQIGVEIGHALACFVQDSMLHFFCATHSWIAIPYSTADPKLHAFFHTIFHELGFFNQYNKFWIGMIHRTWEAIPVDDKHFYRKREGENYPAVYNKQKCEQLAQKAIACLEEKIIQREDKICKCLSIINDNS
jgi:hypothetical protein